MKAMDKNCYALNYCLIYCHQRSKHFVWIIKKQKKAIVNIVYFLIIAEFLNIVVPKHYLF